MLFQEKKRCLYRQCVHRPRVLALGHSLNQLWGCHDISDAQAWYGIIFRHRMDEYDVPHLNCIRCCEKFCLGVMFIRLVYYEQHTVVTGNSGYLLLRRYLTRRIVGITHPHQAFLTAGRNGHFCLHVREIAHRILILAERGILHVEGGCPACILHPIPERLSNQVYRLRGSVSY